MLSRISRNKHPRGARGDAWRAPAPLHRRCHLPSVATRTTSFLQAPLSADYEILREFLPGLNPGFLPEAGTNYGAMLDTAAQAFGTTGAADRFLIVLSDGEATDPSWKERIEPLKKRGIRVLGLGVGLVLAFALGGSLPLLRAKPAQALREL